MSIYFDFKTINELIEDNYYRQKKEFTLEELAQYDGSNEKPAYRAMNEGVIQDKSKFTPDDWVVYITPLVDRAMAEAKEGINPEHLYQEFILSGVLVGLGKTPQQAIYQVEEWENTGTSKLLAKSKINRD